MRLLPLFGLVLVVGGGCVSGMFSDRDRLKQALEEYNEGMRWGKVDGCAAHLPVADRKAFAERFAAVQDDFEVMDYEVQRIEWDRAKGTAKVRVDVSWSLKRRGIVERTVMEQQWQEVRFGWLVTEQHRLQGTPLPLLVEAPIAPVAAPGVAPGTAVAPAPNPEGAAPAPAP